MRTICCVAWSVRELLKGKRHFVNHSQQAPGHEFEEMG